MGSAQTKVVPSERTNVATVQNYKTLAQGQGGASSRNTPSAQMNSQFKVSLND